MKKKLLFLAVFFSLFLASAFAEVSLKAEANKTKITTDQTLTYKIIITTSELNLPQPQLPKFDGFQVLSQAQTTNFSLGKDGPKTELVYAFILLPLLPLNPGKLQIGPASLKINNQVLSTESLEIEVTAGKAVPKPEEIPPESSEPQVTL